MVFTTFWRLCWRAWWWRSVASFWANRWTATRGTAFVSATHTATAEGWSSRSPGIVSGTSIRRSWRFSGIRRRNARSLPAASIPRVWPSVKSVRCSMRYTGSITASQASRVPVSAKVCSENRGRSTYSGTPLNTPGGFGAVYSPKRRSVALKRLLAEYTLAELPITQLILPLILKTEQEADWLPARLFPRLCGGTTSRAGVRRRRRGGQGTMRFPVKPGPERSESHDWREWMTADGSRKGREVFFFNYFQNLWKTVNLSSEFLFAGHFI